MSLTSEQIDALSAPLNSANVKGRKQAGREVSYIESWHAESEANRIFGFDGWDSMILDLRLVSERQVTIGKGTQYEKPGWSVSYICTVRVPVWNGERHVLRDGVGAGHGIDADPGQAHESAVKEAASDAEKRALKTWGNQFGLALYDKTKANVETPPPAPRADDLAINLLRGCGSKELFKDAWERDFEGWKRVMSQDEYARVLRVKQEMVAKFQADDERQKEPA